MFCKSQCLDPKHQVNKNQDNNKVNSYWRDLNENFNDSDNTNDDNNANDCNHSNNIWDSDNEAKTNDDVINILLPNQTNLRQLKGRTFFHAESEFRL